MMQELDPAGIYVYAVYDAGMGPGWSICLLCLCCRNWTWLVYMFTLFMMQELDSAGLYVYLVYDAGIGPVGSICYLAYDAGMGPGGSLCLPCL